jgi:hypothetical protein
MLVSVAAPAAFLVFPSTRRPFASGTKTGSASTQSHGRSWPRLAG